MAKQRMSNFELLRIFSMFCIVLMHSSVDVFAHGGSQFNLYLCVAVNSVCNIGVTCFILISGYFAIQFVPEKLMALELKIIFFSVLSMFLLASIRGNFGIKTAILSFFPIVTRKYWFISCYFALVLLSPFLNKASEALTKRNFQRLLLIMLVIFSVCPTVFRYELMQDSGKGLANMITAYLLGRYLQLHAEKIKQWTVTKLAVAAASILLVEFALNCAETHRIRSGTGVSVPFARDCSFFIIALAVLVFLLFCRLKFTSIVINLIAKSAFTMYLMDAVSRAWYTKMFVDIGQYTSSRFYYGYAFLNAVLAMAIGFLAEWAYTMLLVNTEKTLSEKICSCIKWVWNYLEPKIIAVFG